MALSIKLPIMCGLLTKFNNAECISPTFCGKNTFLFQLFSSLEKTATFPFIYSGAVCCRDAQQTTLKFLFRPEFSDLKLENTAKWKNENKFYLHILEQAVTNQPSSFVSNQQFAILKMDLQKLIFNHFQCICSRIISRVLSQRRHCFLSLLIDVAGGARLML